MQLTWHGHATWYVTVGDTRLLIDPFFDNPKTSLEPGDVDPPDYVLLTHCHGDHTGGNPVFGETAPIIASVVVALAQMFITFYVGSHEMYFLLYLSVAVVLLVRPQGLLGEPEARHG
jgi:glyoxylase-like metal-dependent hydrolase (beta-lactamase superfamily II)